MVCDVITLMWGNLLAHISVQVQIQLEFHVVNPSKQDDVQKNRSRFLRNEVKTNVPFLEMQLGEEPSFHHHRKFHQLLCKLECPSHIPAPSKLRLSLVELGDKVLVSGSYLSLCLLLSTI